MGAGSGYQLPKVQPMSRVGTGKSGVVAQEAARLKQFSPQSQMVGFQQLANQQAADPNADPAQNFYNAQQLYGMNQSAMADDEAKKAALQQQWGEAYGLNQQPQQQPQQEPQNKIYNQATQNSYALRRGWRV